MRAWTRVLKSSSSVDQHMTEGLPPPCSDVQRIAATSGMLICKRRTRRIISTACVVVVQTSCVLHIFFEPSHISLNSRSDPPPKHWQQEGYCNFPVRSTVRDSQVSLTVGPCCIREPGFLSCLFHPPHPTKASLASCKQEHQIQIDPPATFILPFPPSLPIYPAYSRQT